ncbi:MAG: PrgI family protein [Lachnospiraceae bacterium]|nr:PrgI family protein [Lachnospiraceae bacterium]
MLEVTPNKEILKIKNTMFFGFSGKQFMAFCIGMVVGTVLFIFAPVPLFLKPTVLLISMGLIMLPMLFELDGMNLFQFIKSVNETLFGKPLVCENNIDKEVGIDARNRNRQKRSNKGRKA